MTKPLIIGVGNTFRSDDAIGLIVAEQLKQRIGDSVDLFQSQGGGMEVMDAWTGRRAAVIIDATNSESLPAGTLSRFDALEGPLPTIFSSYSTHLFDLAQAIELSRVLGTLPEKMAVYGIEAKNYGHEQRVSPELELALIPLVSIIEKECRSFLCMK